MSRFTKIANVSNQLTGIKITPVLKKTIEKSNIKLVAHTYGGEYFPLYKNGEKRIRNVNEYQAYG